MSHTVSAQNVRDAFDTLVIAAREAGISEADRWHLTTGSKTYGNAFRIWLAHPDYVRGLNAHSTGNYDLPDGWSAHYTPACGEYLGMTKREAFDTMRTLTAAFRAVYWEARKVSETY